GGGAGRGGGRRCPGPGGGAEEGRMPGRVTPAESPGRRPGRSPWPWLALAAVAAATVVALWAEGRPWWCACGRPFLWSGDTQSAHNSQHLFDPYSFTHVLHGLALYGGWPGPAGGWPC